MQSTPTNIIPTDMQIANHPYLLSIRHFATLSLPLYFYQKLGLDFLMPFNRLQRLKLKRFFIINAKFSWIGLVMLVLPVKNYSLSSDGLVVKSRFCQNITIDCKKKRRTQLTPRDSLQKGNSFFHDFSDLLMFHYD